ncbi:hypothetical protein BDR22DRAFT_923215 [Usnea florida]
MTSTTPSGYQPSTTAPAPPPKPSQSQPQTPSSSSYPTAPPLPPPPPTPNPPNANTPTAHPTTSQHQAATPAPPPDPSDQWLPDILLDKSSQTLTHALSHPPLLTSLSTLHPSLTPSPLPPHLSTTTHHARTLFTTHAHLLSLRARTQSHLLHLHALERAWREKQKVMDQELAPWSAKVLYRRLREGEREAEEWCRALEEEWLGGVGEVGDFLRGFREGRVRVWRRREGRERWDEGRVGGWR